MTQSILDPATLVGSGFAHRRVTVNGTNLHYVIGGSGEPLLLWHGFLETWYCWRKVMPTLAGRYTVIAPDMRGYGDSDKPAAGYDAMTLAEDFRALVHQLGFKRVSIVAHDMGAPPALLYAGHYPEEVQALAYLEEPVMLAENLKQMIAFTPQLVQTHGGLWWWAMALAGNMPERLIQGHEREFLTWFYDHYLVDRGTIEETAVAEYLRSFAAPGGVPGAFGVYRAVFQTIAQTEPFARQKIKVPVLGLGGEHSVGPRVRHMLEGVATRVQGGVIPQCGHFIADEQPEALLAQLFAFLGQTANPKG